MKAKRNYIITILQNHCFTESRDHNRFTLKLLIVTLLFGANLSYSQSNPFAFSICNYAPAHIAPLDAPFPMAKIPEPLIPHNEFNILDFGAENSELFRINKAFYAAQAEATKQGGGKIIIPKGKWESGPIHLESNIELHFEEGAELYFSTNLGDYLPAVFSRHQGIECYKFSSLIYANGKSNIAITGNGVLHGQGKAWWKYNDRRVKAWETLEKMALDNIPVRERVFADTLDHFLAPSFIQPINCTQLLIEGITFKYGPFWTVNPVYCENIVIRKVKVETEGKYGHTRNGDGINPTSCKNVLIEYCDLDTGDDCITIKSGRAEDGLRVAKPTENVVIRYCQARQGHGGVVIGSETSGGIKNIYMHQCSFYGTDRGIRIKTARGRGASVENIYISDIQMENIKDEAIVISMLRYTPRFPEHPVTKRTPKYNNINIENVSCKGAYYGIRLVGLPEQPMQNILLRNIKVESNFGFEATDADSVIVSNVEILSKQENAIHITDCQRIDLSKVLIYDKKVLLSGSENSTINFSECNFTSRKDWLINLETPNNEIQVK